MSRTAFTPESPKPRIAQRPLHHLLVLRPEVARYGLDGGERGECGAAVAFLAEAIKHARKLWRLTEEDGVDSASFYDDLDIVDSFINEYRTVLRRLARR